MQELANLLFRDLAALVEGQEYRRVVRGGDSQAIEHLREQGPAADMNTIGVVRQAHAPHGGACRRQNFTLGTDALGSDNVHVPLEVFALAPTGHAFVPEALSDGEPAHREDQGPLARHNHAREGGGHLRAQRQWASALVLECVDLA